MGIVTPLLSNALQQCEYHPDKRELDILFTDGTAATYIGVPQEIWISLVNAASVGGYFNHRIRDVYKVKG